MNDRIMGTVTVSKKALIQLIWYTVKNCGGVVSVGDPSKKNKITSVILKKDEPDGITVTKTKNGIFADVYVVLKYGTDSHTVKDDISEKLINTAAVAGIKINEVNVHIKGIEN